MVTAMNFWKIVLGLTFLALFMSGYALPTKTCTEDSTCASLNGRYPENRCIYNIYEFDLYRFDEQGGPDPDFTRFNIPNSWQNFVNHGTYAGFHRTGKKYTWRKSQDSYLEFECNEEKDSVKFPMSPI